MSWLDELKKSYRMSEVAARYVSLNKISGLKSTARCPFHTEKTPSLSIDDEKNMFYCFGCKEGGDPIKFITKIENLSFIEACRLLCSWYGITISSQQKDDIHFMGDIIEYYKNNLYIKSEALNYLKSRNLKEITIKKYELGWMESVEEFFKFCSDKKISSKNLEAIGIKKILFLLQNRIIFPIYSGRMLVGLGGRYISSSGNKNQPKYINTAETNFFKKKEILYGYNLLDRKQNYVLLVEGYFDVLICNQSGLSAVAPLGTAFSIDHLKKIWEDFEEIIVCFDGDNAGRKAASKLSIEAIPEIRPGKILSFMDLPDGEDPASFFSQNESTSTSTLSASQNSENDKIQKLKYSLIDKLWNLFDPHSEEALEKKTEKYNQLLNKLETIKDKNLRSVYIAECKSRWFRKITKKTKKYLPASPKSTYELILVYTVIYFPNILDRICDYFLSLELTGELELFRETILSSRTIDKSCIEMIESLSSTYTLKNLSNIAPFIKSGNLDLIEEGWMEIFILYSRLKDGGKHAKRK